MTRLLTDETYRAMNPQLPCAHPHWRSFGGFCVIAERGGCAYWNGCRVRNPVRAWNRIIEREARKGRRWRAIVRRYPKLAL